MNRSGEITRLGLSLSEITEALTSHVQIELQQDGALWYLKGCTAYAADGTKRPIPFVEQAFSSRVEAIKAMKREARQDLSSRDGQTPVRIKWQLVRWLPAWTIFSR